MFIFKLHRDKAIDNSILKIKEIKKKNKIINLSLGIVLNSVLNKLNKHKNIKLNTTEQIKNTINKLKKIKMKLEKHGINIEQISVIDIFTNIHYIEFLFTSTHLPYTVDKFKEISFDKFGTIKKSIKLSNGNYEIKYPSFPKTSINFFGNDIYEETKEILSKLEK